MNFKRIILVYKPSIIELRRGSGDITRIKDHSSLLHDQLVTAHEEHSASVEFLKKTAQALKIEVVEHKRNEGLFPVVQSGDLVISAGGDGTFIHASHYCKDVPLLGLNTAPKTSVGHYCAMTIPENQSQTQKLLESLLEDKISIKKYARLQIKVNGELIPPPVINDILIAESNPAATCRYTLKINDKEEFQKSSGIWISTASGSTAAWQSAGGEVFSQLDSSGNKQFGYLVRELYRNKSDSIVSGLLKPDNHFRLVSGMGAGRLFLDGSHLHKKIKPGDVIEIGFYEHDLQSIMVHSQGKNI